MKRIRALALASLSFALVLGALGIFESLPTISLKSTSDMNSWAVVGGPKLTAQYESWAARHEANGGNHNVLIALGPDWDHTTVGRYANGTAKLDLIDGKVAAAIRDLPQDSEWDLWLVDNAPGRDDVHLFAGRLESNGEYLQLAAELGAGVFDRFQVDRVVVARAGEDPADGHVIAGSASLFQRLYTALESEATLFASDFADRVELVESGSSAWGIRSAMAQRDDTIFVDADVLASSLVADGANLFINEQFNGNGRSCSTCHPAKENTTIDVEFIASLPDDDALFVAEFTPALAENFEKPALMRGGALILENIDGMDDLANKFVMRGVPHTLGLSTSVTGPTIPFDNSAPDNSGFPPVSFDPFIPFPVERTGWGGDGAPNTGALRDFATGAVNQHFPKTLARMEPGDFRFPTPAELDAMEAFQRALGRQADLDLASIPFRNPRVQRGVEIFNRLDTGNPPAIPGMPPPPQTGPPLPAGKCALCHSNAGANINAGFFSGLLGAPVSGNANFGTGVNELSSPPADLIDPANNPRDGGFGIIPHDGTPLPQLGGVPCVPPTGGFGVVTLPGGVLPPGLCEEDFNTPPLVEAADTGAFFHNNAVQTLEAAVGFYNDAAFNFSPGGQLAAALDTNGIGIEIDASEVTAIASMLRVVNALENIRAAREQGTAAFNEGTRSISHDLIRQAIAEAEDAVEVLHASRLHPVAQRELEEAIKDGKNAIAAVFESTRQSRLLEASAHVDAAEADIIDTGP